VEEYKEILVLREEKVAQQAEAKERSTKAQDEI